MRVLKTQQCALNDRTVAGLDYDTPVTFVHVRQQGVCVVCGSEARWTWAQGSRGVTETEQLVTAEGPRSTVGF